MVRRLGRYDHRRFNILRFLRCAVCGLLGVTRADRLHTIKITEDTFTPESITDVIRHRRFRWFGHVCWMRRNNIVMQASKHDFNGPRKRGRPLKRWSDQIKNDTGLPLLTAERHVTNRTKWRGATSGRTARGHNVICF